MLMNGIYAIGFALALSLAAVAPVAAQGNQATKTEKTEKTDKPEDREAAIVVAGLRVAVAVAARDNDLIEARIAALPNVEDDVPRLVARWLFDVTLNKPGLGTSERTLTTKLESLGKKAPLAAMRAMKFFERGISARDIRDLAGNGTNAPKTEDLIVARLAHGFIESYRGKDDVVETISKDIALMAQSDDAKEFRVLASPEGQFGLYIVSQLLRHGMGKLPAVLPMPLEAEPRREVVLILDLIDTDTAVATQAVGRIATSNGFGACVAGNLLLAGAQPEAARPVFDALAQRAAATDGRDAALMRACAAARDR